MLNLIIFLRRPTLRPTLDPSQTVVLNRGHVYSNRYNSAEGALFTHVYEISLVSSMTLTNSHYGLWVETHLTSTRQLNSPKPGITQGNDKVKL